MRTTRALYRLSVPVLVSLLGVAACAGPTAPRAPEFADHPARVDWSAVLVERLAPLNCDRGGRWPMILWEGPGFEPLPAETLRALLDRGIVPHLRPDAAMIPAARAIKAAGGPVILMAGQSGAWGYGRPETLIAMDIANWKERADEIRATMRAFRDSGTTVDAVWLDYEVAPLRLSYDSVLADPDGLGRGVPAGALASPEAFAVWARRLFTGLMSAYAAAPVREVFPAASVANWMTVVSTAKRPVPGLVAGAVPPSDPGLFTATNPVAYGTDAGFRLAGGRVDMDRDAADRIYMGLIMGQVSADAANRQQGAPHLSAVPWVGRWVPLDQKRPNQAGGLGVRVAPSEDGLGIIGVFPESPASAAGLKAGDIVAYADGVALGTLELKEALRAVRGREGTDVDLVIQRGDARLNVIVTRDRLDGGPAPVMSRERYREALRHLWLRGIDGMQVFNSTTPGHAEIAIAEVEDAQAVYAEALALGDLLGGEPMNLDGPGPDDTILWSGLRKGNTAAVRAVSVGAWRDTLTLHPWPGTTVVLPVSEAGATWLLSRDPQSGLVGRAPAPRACSG